jgi:hypothetical protein
MTGDLIISTRSGLNYRWLELKRESAAIAGVKLAKLMTLLFP